MTGMPTAFNTPGHDDAFLINLFKVLEENPDMTATAVVELAIGVPPTMGQKFGIVEYDALAP